MNEAKKVEAMNLKLIIIAFLISGSAIQSQTIAVLGTGYVGLVLSACLASYGNDVIGVDIDETKIKNLQKGAIPFFEPGLDQLVIDTVANKKLKFSTDITTAITIADIIFIAVGTPVGKDGKADVSMVMQAAQSIIEHTTTQKIICLKSTVPIGCNSSIENMIINAGKDHLISVVSNPEFLKEGNAVFDFFNPDRVIIGGSNEQAVTQIAHLYDPIKLQGIPFLLTDAATAETIKYVSNAFLAVKVSYCNEIAHLCEHVGADCNQVLYGMGLDKRIGPSYLKPGPGYGGSCLPKDTTALLSIAKELNVDLHVVRGAVKANQTQRSRILDTIVQFLGGIVANKTIAIWGLSFKAHTDDIRESAAIDIINELQKKGSLIQAYDPRAMANMKKIIPDIYYCTSAQDALQNADLLLVLTEWPEFSNYSTVDIAKKMKGPMPIIIDMRDILHQHTSRSTNCIYYVIGSPNNRIY